MPSTAGPWNTIPNFAFPNGMLVAANAFSSDPATLTQATNPSASALAASHQRLRGRCHSRSAPKPHLVISIPLTTLRRRCGLCLRISAQMYTSDRRQVFKSLQAAMPVRLEPSKPPFKEMGRLGSRPFQSNHLHSPSELIRSSTSRPPQKKTAPEHRNTNQPDGRGARIDCKAVKDCCRAVVLDLLINFE